MSPFQGFHVQDRLREVLLNEDNEYELDHGPVFSDDQKSELLYAIFRHLAIGGSLCQFEDTVEPYLEVAKLCYKAMLTVWKNPKTSKAEVASGVYSIEGVVLRRGKGGGEGDGGGGGGDDEDDLFGGQPSVQTWLYVATDPFRRTCNVWLHKFKHHW